MSRPRGQKESAVNKVAGAPIDPNLATLPRIIERDCARHVCRAFDDAFALVEQDESEDYGEDRLILIGGALEGILTIVYTERDGRIRIISAREANGYERRNYYRAAQEK